MKKDREIDRAIATKIMGHKVVRARTLDLGWKERGVLPPYHFVAGIKPNDFMLGDTAKGGTAHVLPRYSLDLFSSWPIVEKLSDRFHAVIKTPFQKGAKFVCGFTPLGCSGWNGRPDFQAVEATLPLAICKAALLTIGKRKHEVG